MLRLRFNPVTLRKCGVTGGKGITFMMLLIDTPDFNGYVNTNLITYIMASEYNSNTKEWVLRVSTDNALFNILIGSQKLCEKCADSLAETINSGKSSWAFAILEKGDGGYGFR